MEQVAVYDPPAPVSVVATSNPLMPLVPYLPIVTTNDMCGGKLVVWMVTRLFLMTLSISKVEIFEVRHFQVLMDKTLGMQSTCPAKTRFGFDRLFALAMGFQVNLY
jgi:hypothetical protein